MRTAAFTDPDGHVWEVAAKIPRPHLVPHRVEHMTIQRMDHVGIVSVPTMMSRSAAPKI
jgi:hypothetical protein